MKQRSSLHHTTAFLLMVALCAAPNFLLAAPAAKLDAATDGRKATLAVRKMLASIRLKRSDNALKYIGLEEMSVYLLGSYYKKFTPAQLARFQTLLGTFVKKRAFPLAIKYIGRVGLSYDKPRMKKDRVHVKSSVVYSGSERLVFTWVLAKGKDGQLRVSDFLNSAGKSSMQKNRDKQIQPLLRKRGPAGLLKALDRLVRRL